MTFPIRADDTTIYKCSNGKPDLSDQIEIAGSLSMTYLQL